MYAGVQAFGRTYHNETWPRDSCTQAYRLLGVLITTRHGHEIHVRRRTGFWAYLSRRDMATRFMYAGVQAFGRTYHNETWPRDSCTQAYRLLGVLITTRHGHEIHVRRRTGFWAYLSRRDMATRFMYAGVQAFGRTYHNETWPRDSCTQAYRLLGVLITTRHGHEIHVRRRTGFWAYLSRRDMATRFMYAGVQAFGRTYHNETWPRDSCTQAYRLLGVLITTRHGHEIHVRRRTGFWAYLSRRDMATRFMYAGVQAFGRTYHNETWPRDSCTQAYRLLGVLITTRHGHEIHVRRRTGFWAYLSRRDMATRFMYAGVQAFGRTYHNETWPRDSCTQAYRLLGVLITTRHGHEIHVRRRTGFWAYLSRRDMATRFMYAGVQAFGRTYHNETWPRDSCTQAYRLLGVLITTRHGHEIHVRRRTGFWAYLSQRDMATRFMYAGVQAFGRTYHDETWPRDSCTQAYRLLGVLITTRHGHEIHVRRRTGFWAYLSRRDMATRFM